MLAASIFLFGGLREEVGPGLNGQAGARLQKACGAPLNIAGCPEALNPASLPVGERRGIAMTQIQLSLAVHQICVGFFPSVFNPRRKLP